MRRWRCATAICASAGASVKWSGPRRGRSKNFRQTSWRRFGRRPRRNSQAEEASAPRSRRAQTCIAGAAMIQIRACAGLDEMEACVELQIETWGYDESDVIPRKTFLLAQKIGGQVIGAFDSELAGSSGGDPPKPWSVSPCLCRESRRPQKGRALTSTPTCWPSAPPTAIAALARNSNGSNGVRRFRAAFGTWSGPSIRWRSRTLFSISTGWAPSLAPTLWISMVYPHLDCKVGFRRIVFWPSGSWIPRE